MTFDEFDEIFTEEEKAQLLDYLVDNELKEWKAILADDNALTIENAKKIFDNGWQWWNTYNNTEDVLKIDKNDIDCGSMKFDLVDWDKLFKLVKEDDDFDYNIHQYCDWAVIFVYFEKDGIRVDCPFVNDNWEEHLEEDFERGLYNSKQERVEITEDFVRDAISKPVNATWR